jgi:hypothetical protein
LRDFAQTRGNGLAQAVDAENGFLEGICSDLSQHGLELGKELLDWI